jgi:hypothetical protein
MSIGNNNSVKNVVDIIQRHNHSPERWFVAAAAPSGETHVADNFGDGSVAFQADGGSDTWGAWIQIIGSSDTPVGAGNVFFDFHKILLTANERNDTIYKFQFAHGDSGAAALAAGDFTEFPIITQTGITNVDPISIQSERIAVGTKVWARTWAVGQVTGTIDFYIGLHEYPA